MEWRSLCDGAPWSSSLWHLCSNHWVDFIMKPLTTFSFVPHYHCCSRISLRLICGKLLLLIQQCRTLTFVRLHHVGGPQVRRHKFQSILVWGFFLEPVCLFLLSLCYHVALAVGTPWKDHHSAAYCAIHNPQCLQCLPDSTMFTVPPTEENVMRQLYVHLVTRDTIV